MKCVLTFVQLMGDTGTLCSEIGEENESSVVANEERGQQLLESGALVTCIRYHHTGPSFNFQLFTEEEIIFIITTTLTSEFGANAIKGNYFEEFNAQECGSAHLDFGGKNGWWKRQRMRAVE